MGLGLLGTATVAALAISSKLKMASNTTELTVNIVETRVLCGVLGQWLHTSAIGVWSQVTGG